MEYIMQKEEYNNIPVYFCKHCLSLKVRGVEDMNYCDDCSSTEIEQCSIEEWNTLYKKKFGHNYLDKY